MPNGSERLSIGGLNDSDTELNTSKIAVRAGWPAHETIHSHLSRIWFLLGGLPSTTLRIQAFGPSPKHMSITLPGNLEHLTKVLPVGSPTLDDLIEHHTVYRYHAAFMTDEARLHLRKMLACGWEASAQGRMGFLRAAVPKHPYLTFCAHCAGEHQQEFGSSAWICDHQLPGVEICHRHGVRLQMGPWEAGHTTQFQPCPVNVEHYPDVPVLLPPDIASRLARESSALLRHPYYFPSAARVHAAMATLIVERGFVRRGQIQRKDLHELMRTCLGDLAINGFGLVDVVGIQPRLLHALHEHRVGRFSATCRYLLLLVVLGFGIDDLWGAICRTDPPDCTVRKGAGRNRQATAETLELHKLGIQQAMAEHPEWTRLNLFHNVRRFYSTVTRDDRDWWEAHAPRSHRVIRRLDYDLRDRQQAQRIRDIGPRLQALRDANAKITRTTIMREAGLRATLRPRAHLDPLTLAALLEALGPRRVMSQRKQRAGISSSRKRGP